MTDFRSTLSSDWDGIDRRRAPRDQYEEKRIEHSGNPQDPITREYLDQALSDWRHSSREYFNTHFIRLEELIRDGFPEGDPSAHRKVHECYIAKANKRSEMWDSVFKQILSGGVWAGLMAVGTALWIVFKAEVKK